MPFSYIQKLIWRRGRPDSQYIILTLSETFCPVSSFKNRTFQCLSYLLKKNVSKSCIKCFSILLLSLLFSIFIFYVLAKSEYIFVKPKLVWLRQHETKTLFTLPSLAESERTSRAEEAELNKQLEFRILWGLIYVSSLSLSFSWHYMAICTKFHSLWDMNQGNSSMLSTV